MGVRHGVIRAVVGIGVLPAAAPASAKTTVVHLPNTSTMFGVSSITTADDQSDPLYRGVTVTQVARGENLGNPLSSSQTNMGIQCGAVATGAAAVGIVRCYLKGRFTAEVHHAMSTGAKPGVADALADVKTGVTSQPYQVCVQTRVLLRDGSTPYLTPEVCSET